MMIACAVSAWILRYPAEYYFYLWQLNRTEHGSDILDLNEKIEAIAPHIVPLLVRTYVNVDAPPRSRNAAALALIRADRARAEDLFLKFLQTENPKILVYAVWNLGTLGSVRPYRTIVTLASTSKDEEVRWAAVQYLGHIKSDESIAVLRQLSENDKSTMVRDAATYTLKRLGVLPSQ